jgi:AcrR family transcriptional regulator
MPRGVAIGNAREVLFDAAERVLARQGPAGLTNRAITTEAGCAKGLLYNHFADLDEFIAQLVLRHFERVAAQAANLPAQIGTATVARNLTDAALALLGPPGPAIAAIALSRPGVSGRLRDAWRHGAPGFPVIEQSLVDYVVAELDAGRLAPGTEPRTVALAVVGVAHHLLMTGGADPRDARTVLGRLVAALLGQPESVSRTGARTAGRTAAPARADAR